GGVDRFDTKKDISDDIDSSASAVEKQQEASGPYQTCTNPDLIRV
ncbi:unnamed protein product, partial [Rotaria sordida]